MRIDYFNESYCSKAYVVFEDNTTLWWLKFLKKDFRHCYILIPNKAMDSWLEINPMSNQLFIKHYEFSKDTDYALYLNLICKKHVLSFDIVSAPMKCAPLAFFTCVEFTKRFFGFHNRFIITPYQLYKKIKSSRKKVLT